MKIFDKFFKRRPEPAPETLVETWIVEILDTPQGPVLNRTLISTQTWSKLPSFPPLPNGDYGVDNPIVSVLNTLSKRHRYFSYTKSDFERIFEAIPIRAKEERAKIRDSYGEMLEGAIKELKEIHARITGSN